MNKLTNFLAGLLVSGAVLVPALMATAAGNNLIPNSSVETSVSGTSPDSWSTYKTGTNTTAYNYLNTGHTGSRSVQVQMTKRTGGQAEWVFNNVSVSPNTKYTFSDWYQSNVQTHYAVIVTSTGGGTSSFTTSNVPSSASWKQGSISFTTPRNAVSLTVRHYINSIGQLTTDDSDLEGPTVTAPTVSVSTPVVNATVSGTQTVTATTTAGSYTIKNVQFQLDGVNLGTADTSSPYSTSWNTKNTVNGNHNLTAILTTTSGLTITSSPVNVNVNNVVTLPTVNISTPVANATVSGSQTVTATTTAGSYAISNVQFQIDGVNLGTADTTAPYSVSWNTKNNTFGAHNLTAIVNTTTTGVSATSPTVPVNVNNATPPVVSISAPGANATVNATTALTASATDALGITGVQFKLNGNNVGPVLTAAPYTYNWDTTTVADGGYTLTAVATNQASLSTTSAAVTVLVKNTAGGGSGGGATGANLIPNPSVETANGTAPADWLSSNWGTNTSAFTYLTTGHTGSHSIKVQTTSYTNGAANWYYADVPVTAGTTYQYTNWYQANVDTEVDAEVTMTDGTINYYYLGTVLANTNWTKFSSTFTPPAGAKTMAVYQILAKVGYIVSDDYSLNTYTPAPFTRGIVSVSFDDGWLNQYQNALPILQQNGIAATFNIITDSSITNPDPEYMNLTQIKTLLGDGYEIASHSETHPDLTTVSQANLVKEMGESQSILQNALGVAVPDFAYPFGAYNTNTLTVGSQYYQTQRTVNAGYNTKDNLDLTQLKIYEVDSNISQAQVKGWIDGAIAQNSWLILVYHETATSPTDPTDALYTTQPADLAAEMAYLKSTGVATETVHQAVNEILPQLQ